MAYFQKDVNINEDENQKDNQTANGGNIYSTSSSEVSTGDNGNQESSNGNSSSGSKWSNLQGYLDANRNKAGRYANSFVEDDLNKSSAFSNNLQNAQKSYLNSIKNDDAYKYSQEIPTASGLVYLPNNDQKVKSFINNSSSLSNNDKNLVMNTIKGYQGDKQFSTTGDKYGYNQLRSDSDYFNNLSNNITNENYLKSQMGNKISSGSKNLNSLLLSGSSDAQNILNNAKQNYTNATNAFNTTLNNLDNEYSKVVAEANKNTTNARNAAAAEKARIESIINDQYNKNKAAYEQQKQFDSANPFSDTGSLYTNKPKDIIWDLYQVKDDLSKQATENRNRELNELQQRYDYLLGKISNPGNSKTDYDFGFTGNYRDPTQAEIDLQLQRSNNFFRNISAPKYDYTPESQEQLEKILRAYVQGKIDDRQAKEYVSGLTFAKKKATPSGLRG